jgi:hypothetical protein
MEYHGISWNIMGCNDVLDSTISISPKSHVITRSSPYVAGPHELGWRSRAS